MSIPRTAANVRRGQIFVQDIGASLVIAIITILSLIAFINMRFDMFKSRVENDHSQLVFERIVKKLFVEHAYDFNTGKYSVNRRFVQFLNNLNDDEYYESFREDAALSREGISYDVYIRIDCENGVDEQGGRMMNNMRYANVLVNMEGSYCRVLIGVGKR